MGCVEQSGGLEWKRLQPDVSFWWAGKLLSADDSLSFVNRDQSIAGDLGERLPLSTRPTYLDVDEAQSPIVHPIIVCAPP
jgi:hypothetical protein